MGLDVHDVSIRPIQSTKTRNGNIGYEPAKPQIEAGGQWRCRPCTLDAAPLEAGMVITVEP